MRMFLPAQLCRFFEHQMRPFMKELSLCKTTAQVRGDIFAKTLFLGKVLNELLFLTLFANFSHRNTEFLSVIRFWLICKLKKTVWLIFKERSQLQSLSTLESLYLMTCWFGFDFYNTDQKLSKRHSERASIPFVFQ